MISDWSQSHLKFKAEILAWYRKWKYNLRTTPSSTSMNPGCFCTCNAQPHLRSETHAVEVAAGVGMESELGRWITGAGAESGYHVHLNKGPVLGRARGESEQRATQSYYNACPRGSFIKTAWIEPHVAASRADVGCRRGARMSKTKQKCEYSFLPGQPFNGMLFSRASKQIPPAEVGRGLKKWKNSCVLR